MGAYGSWWEVTVRIDRQVGLWGGIFDFKDRFNLDGGAGGNAGESKCAAGVITVAVLAENLVQQVGGAVDDQVLLNKIRRGIDTSQQLDDPQSIQGAVRLMNRLQNLDSAILGGLIALLCREAGAKLAFQVANMSRGNQPIAAADTEIEITRFLGGKR